MIHCYLIEKGKLREDLELSEILEASRPDGSFAWIDLEDPSKEDLKLLGENLGVHDLTLEDIREAEGRPRFEEFADHVFVVFKALNFNVGEDVLDAINVNFLVFEDFLITAHDCPVRSITEIRTRLTKKPSRFRHGPSRMLYSILDGLVDRYFDLAEELEESLEKLEPRVLGELDRELPQKLYDWKRRIIRIRRRFGPHREVLMTLCTAPHDVLPPEGAVYFRDVLDRVMRIDDRLAGYRDLLQGAGELYMAGAAQETNEVMKTLSIVATVVLPLNILTGLYGTNFDVLPGAKAGGAFWFFLGAMALIALLTAGYFRRRGWI